MKKYLFGLPALLLLMGGCKKATLPGFVNFDVKDTQTITVPAGTVGTLGPITVSSNAPAAYAANNTDSDYVQNVKVAAGALTLVAPAGQTFGALTGAEVKISSDTGGQDQFVVGTAGATAAGATTLALAPGATPIDMFVSKPTYYLFITLQPGQVLARPATLRVDLSYQVRARVK